MLATMTHFQKGTPYVYQGEELGMTNAYMENIADYRDIESLNAYKELTTKENIPAKTVMGYIKQLDVTMHVHQCSGTHLTMAALHRAHHGCR